LFTQGNTALAANVVASAEMADNAITNAEMADNAIRDAELNSAAVTKDSIFALSSNGFIQRTAANTYSTKSLTQTDTIMVEIPAAAFDTTSTAGGKATRPTFVTQSGFRAGYWEFDASQAETLITIVKLPDYFSSIPRIAASWIGESTGADTLEVDMEGFANDEAGAFDVALATKAATIISATGPAANDWRFAEDFSISGTYSANDVLFVEVMTRALDTGVKRFFGLEIYVVRAE